MYVGVEDQSVYADSETISATRTVKPSEECNGGLPLDVCRQRVANQTHRAISCNWNRPRFESTAVTFDKTR